MLPSQVVDFWIILLFWFVAAWAARIVHLTVSLKEVRRAIDAGQITVHRDVPLHSSISWLDAYFRSRFLSFLRARVPPTPTAPVQAFSNPVVLRAARVAGEAGSPRSLLLNLDCTHDATLVVYWAVDPTRCEVVSSTGGSGASRLRRGVGSRSAAIRPSALGSASGLGERDLGSHAGGRAPRAILGGVLGRRVASSVTSSQALPVVSSIELQSCSGHDERGDRRGSADASPSHVLAAGSYKHASAPVRLRAGNSLVVSLDGEQLPPPAAVDEALASELPLVVLVSSFVRPAHASDPAPLAEGAEALPSSLTDQSRAPLLCAAHFLGLSDAADAADADAERGATRASVTKVVVRTPDGRAMVLSEVFGLSDWKEELCVACLSEPRDTILLPCRHLCVCTACFDHLIRDLCPVCRTSFSSYLRFPTGSAPASPRDEPAALSVAPSSPPASDSRGVELTVLPVTGTARCADAAAAAGAMAHTSAAAPPMIVRGISSEESA